MNYIHIFILSSKDTVLNQKTCNSLALIQQLPITTTWINDIASLTNAAISEKHCVIIPAGDHLTRSYLEAFLALNQPFDYAYQPQFSFLFAYRGKTFYRRNIDISPVMEEINALLLAPHHARHIIFASIHLNEIISTAPVNERNLFWHISQYLLTKQITLVTLSNCISMEYQNLDILHNKTEIVQNLYPKASASFDKQGLLFNQNFSDLYGN